ncbi:unnamed protein product [Lactuca virosa]|uniref:Uncharacterized protein n=1 Tax=Lactuca virosa TaxID=75947 RepID=A0AAU9P9N0_9ASTR|nr:unnamed protein product [Lactuca virosa]
MSVPKIDALPLGYTPYARNTMMQRMYFRWRCRLSAVWSFIADGETLHGAVEMLDNFNCSEAKSRNQHNNNIDEDKELFDRSEIDCLFFPRTLMHNNIKKKQLTVNAKLRNANDALFIPEEEMKEVVNSETLCTPTLPVHKEKNESFFCLLMELKLEVQLQNAKIRTMINKLQRVWS